MKTLSDKQSKKSSRTKSGIASKSAKSKIKLPISDSVYNDLSRRFMETLCHSWNGQKSIEEAIDLFDSYIAGGNIDKKLEAVTLEARIAFMMVRPEIDRAMQRSINARRRAQLRKEKLEAQKNGSVKSMSEKNVPVKNESVVIYDTGFSPQTPNFTNRRERRLYEREMARNRKKALKRRF